jgi:2-methylcitrate dehydratase PrpD
VESIERIRIEVDSVTYAAEIHDPKNGNQAQFSVAFAVSVALLNGNASIFQYTDENVANARVRALMAKIRVQANTKLDEDYPDKRGATAEILLIDGARYNGAIENAKGEPECPLSAEDVERKFLAMATPIIGRRGAERIRDGVAGLERLGDAGALIQAWPN